MNLYPWQQEQWQFLCNLYQQNQLPHALLLNGQAGLGKFQFATGFSKFLLCLDSNKTTEMAACNHCKQCNLINNETNPDLQILTFEESQIIKLEQIRNVIEYMNKTSQFNNFKIVIIYPAEKMNSAAANALLKNLEEPHGKQVLFLLVTHQFMQLPATIRSRCQRVNFYVPQLAELKSWLITQSVDVTSDDFDVAYQLAQGAPLAMCDYLSNSATIKLFQTVNSLFVDRDWSISDWAAKLNKEPVTEFLYCLQLVLINLIKNDLKVEKDPLHYFLNEVSLHKKTLDNGIALNAQLIIEDYLRKIKLLGNKE